MSMINLALAPVLLLVVLLVGLLAPAATAQKCSGGPPTFVETQPYGAESYSSLYAWLINEVIRQNNTVTGLLVYNSTWVAENTSNPNIYFSARPPDQACSVNLTFIGAGGNYRNQIGWYPFDPTQDVGVKVNFSSLALLFPDVPSGAMLAAETACLPQGSTVTIGPVYDPNLAIGFYLNMNGFNTNPTSINSTRLWSLDEQNRLLQNMTLWSNATRAYGRTVAILREPTSNAIYLGFEDNPPTFMTYESGFNDVVIKVTSNCTIDTTLIPCYSTCRYEAQAWRP